MAKLTARMRKALPKKDFALPSRKGKGGKNKAGRGAFPINDNEHAEKAIQLAPRSLHAGNITKSEEQTIIRKAKKKLGQSGKMSKKPSKSASSKKPMKSKKAKVAFGKNMSGSSEVKPYGGR